MYCFSAGHSIWLVIMVIAYAFLVLFFWFLLRSSRGNIVGGYRLYCKGCIYGGVSCLVDSIVIVFRSATWSVFPLVVLGSCSEMWSAFA